jgi:hypothetical protein
MTKIAHSILVSLSILLGGCFRPSTDLPASETVVGLVSNQPETEVLSAPSSAETEDEAETQSDSAASVTLAPLDRVREAAGEMLETGRAEVWGREGELDAGDLSCSYASEHPDGLAAFNVLDSAGYRDALKCNLFAFELAYRAGLIVPLIGRARGWSYPGPDGLILMIEGGGADVDGRWARLADGLSPEELGEATDAGRVFLIVGSGLRARPGHVGVIEQIHLLERTPRGRISRVEYTGWETSARGARHARFSWRPGRFFSTHLLELRAAAQGESQIVLAGDPPQCASLLDAERHDPRAAARAGASRCRPITSPMVPVLSTWTRSIMANEAETAFTVDPEQVLRRGRTRLER